MPVIQGVDLFWSRCRMEAQFKLFSVVYVNHSSFPVDIFTTWCILNFGLVSISSWFLWYLYLRRHNIRRFNVMKNKIPMCALSLNLFEVQSLQGLTWAMSTKELPIDLTAACSTAMLPYHWMLGHLCPWLTFDQHDWIHLMRMRVWSVLLYLLFTEFTGLLWTSSVTSYVILLY